MDDSTPNTAIGGLAPDRAVSDPAWPTGGEGGRSAGSSRRTPLDQRALEAFSREWEARRAVGLGREGSHGRVAGCQRGWQEGKAVDVRSV